MLKTLLYCQLIHSIVGRAVDNHAEYPEFNSWWLHKFFYFSKCFPSLLYLTPHRRILLILCETNEYLKRYLNNEYLKRYLKNSVKNLVKSLKSLWSVAAAFLNQCNILPSSFLNNSKQINIQKRITI